LTQSINIPINLGKLKRGGSNKKINRHHIKFPAVIALKYKARLLIELAAFFDFGKSFFFEPCHYIFL
jgi:hypothetical protein